MTRRERLERRMALRTQWADSAHTRSAEAHDRVSSIADGIPLGQPILVGHHSERRARRDAARIRAGMTRAVEEHRLAVHHERKADGIDHQLARSIFDDDPNAIALLQRKISELEKSCQCMARANRLWSKGGHDAVLAEFGPGLAAAAEEVMSQGYSWIRRPFSTASARAEIRRCKKRIAIIAAQRSREEQAVAAGGLGVEGDRWVRVTFAEKPPRPVLQELRAAGFRWAKGSWHGLREKLPLEVQEQIHPTSGVERARAGQPAPPATGAAT